MWRGGRGEERRGGEKRGGEKRGGEERRYFLTINAPFTRDRHLFFSSSMYVYTEPTFVVR